MSWYFGGPNLSAITALLDKPDTTVEKILDESALNAALRNGLDALINFLFENNENLEHIIDLALTDIVPETSLPAKTTRTAVQVLTMANSGKIFEKLRENPVFIGRLDEFPNTQYAADPRACGHYGRIVDAFARATTGKFLENLSTLKKFICEKMSNLGLRELFMTLISDYPSSFGATKEFFVDLIKAVTPETAFYVISGISSVAQNKSDIFEKIQNIEFLKNLLAIAKKEEENRPLIIIEAFLLAEKIVQAIVPNAEVEALIAEEENAYDFSKERPESITSAALRVFHTKNPAILLKVLEKQPSTFINEGVCNSLDVLTNDDLAALNANSEFTRKLMDVFPTTKSNVHLSRVAETFNKVNKEVQGWEAFIIEVEKRDNQRKADFGGPRPKLIISSDYDNEDDDDDEANKAENLFDDSEEDSDDLGSDNSDELDNSSSDSDDDDDDDEDDVFDIKKTTPQPKLHKFGSKPVPVTQSDSSDSSDEGDERVELKLPPAPPLAMPILDTNSSDDDYYDEDEIPTPIDPDQIVNTSEQKYDEAMNIDSDDEPKTNEEGQEKKAEEEEKHEEEKAEEPKPEENAASEDKEEAQVQEEKPEVAEEIKPAEKEEEAKPVEEENKPEEPVQEEAKAEEEKPQEQEPPAPAQEEEVKAEEEVKPAVEEEKTEEQPAQEEQKPEEEKPQEAPEQEAQPVEGAKEEVAQVQAPADPEPEPAAAENEPVEEPKEAAKEEEEKKEEEPKTE